MLSAAHTIISLPFGLAFANPLLAFISALLMHLVCDMLLHWNIYPQNYKKYPFILVGIDVAVGLIISYFLLGNGVFTVPIMAAIAGGNAADVAHALWKFLLPQKRKDAPGGVQAIFYFHEKIQWETESPLLGGLSQVILCTIAIFLILSLK